MATPVTIPLIEHCKHERKMSTNSQFFNKKTSKKQCIQHHFQGCTIYSYGLLFLFLLTQIPSSSAEGNVTEDRCLLNKTRKCSNGIIVPLWPPENPTLLTTTETFARASVFFISLFYLFLGVSIVADRFMASIEVITSKEKEIVYKTKNGESMTTTVRIWNETVSNLTLMALGSSAPEIMLSVIEICGKKFTAGELGPSTIVGSASFNLFIIIAICMYVIPDGEVRRIKHPRVFFITATWSIFAYVWLYIILAVISKGVVEVWEGVVTFLFFPVLVVFAWIADRRLLVYKYMYKRYRRHKTVIVEIEGEGSDVKEETEGSGDLHLTELGENGKAGSENHRRDSNVTYADDLDDVVDPETHRKNMIKLMRELRKKHPDADMAELARLASAQTISHQHKSRAFYRIQATRKLIGAGNILNKGKAEQMQSAESAANILQDEDDSIAKIFFDPADYKVLENCGSAELKVSRKGGDFTTTLYVDYRTIDGTANAGSDFEFIENTLRFEPGETVKSIFVKILDDDVFEEDEYFTVELFNVRSGSAEGMFDTNANSNTIARLDAPSVAHVIILDDDHAGVFTFSDDSMTVNEGVGILKIEVQRNSGARGKISVPYRTVSGTAKGGGEDFVDAFGELEFENDETSKFINIQIIDDEEYEKNKSFFLELSTPKQIAEKTDSGAGDESNSGVNGKEKLPAVTEVDEDDKRIAELGKPRLGQYSSIEIVIEESYEFKNTVDKLIKKANLAVMVSTSSWRDQFAEAISVNGGGGDEEEGEGEAEPTGFDYVMHYLTIFWKVLFAFVPPTDYFGGWACFTASISMIGLLTAVIGDVASQFGCIVNLNDAVTAVTLVAMGTSVPDTFASKVAAVGDEYADASIGNVTGSNAVNVFLGIGIAWTIAAVYWAVVGTTEEGRKFKVPPGNLAFSVTVFSIFACIAVAVLMFRRKSKSIGGELGGPRKQKTISALFFLLLWVIYIVLAALDSYCVIKTF